MPATSVLDREMVFLSVPLKSTKRGFAIPFPAVLRKRAIDGKENPKDKEWDGRSASFTWTPQRFYAGRMVYTPVGKAGFTKTITDVNEVDHATWAQTMQAWRQYLRDHAEDFTNTHAIVNRQAVNSALLSHAVATPTRPVPTTPTPQVMPIVVNNGPLPMPTWDPADPDIAHDLFDVPADNPNFLPDRELFQIFDASWKDAITANDSRHILVYGDTSTGKSEHPLIWAARNDILVCRVDCGGFGEIYDVTGPIKAVERNGSSVTEWVKGKLIRAFADPRPALILLDEGNRISDVKAMNILFPFLDSARQSYFDDASAWMKLNGVKLIVMTMNGDTRGDDIGEYVGTQPLDQAFISRFPIRKQLRYPDADKLTNILTARAQNRVSPDQIRTVAEIAQELVALNKFVPNLRELFACLDFLIQGVDIYHALKWTVGGIYKFDGTAACDFVSFRAVLIGKNINVDEA
jgi:hypothetical protein